VEIETNASDWRDEDFAGEPGLLKRLREEVVLADGGIYDNMGLESLNEDIKLVSDAGAPFSIEESLRSDYFSQLGRVRDILIDQTRALRKSELIDAFKSARLCGAYWGIGTKIANFPATQKLASDTATTAALETIATRLAATPRDVQDRLINWGYVLADAALRSRADLSIPASAGLPRPAHPLD
jgi:NTE family protein